MGTQKDISEKFAEAWKLIQKSRAILLVSPEAPDIDSISSVAAFRLFLRERMPRKTKIAMWCPNPLDTLKENSLFPFIEGGRYVRRHFPKWKPDCIIAFDYGNIERARLPKKYKDIPVIGFDHHARKGPAPDIEVVDETLPSCTALLYKVFVEALYPIGGSTVARTLLAGLITDTGRFSNQATTSEALKIASNMDPRNEFLPAMLEASRRRISLDRLAVWQKIFADYSNLEFDKESCLLTLVADQKSMKRWGAESRRDVFTAFGILQDLEEVSVAAVIFENSDGSWQVSLRAGPVHGVPVKPIAEEFGGGGHPYAAAFPFKGDIRVLLASLKNTILARYVWTKPPR